MNSSDVTVQDVHVSGSDGDVARGRVVACLWAGCKVYGVESISSTWLSKHVTSHVGSKPFLCIVSGCRLRFGNQVRPAPGAARINIE